MKPPWREDYHANIDYFFITTHSRYKPECRAWMQLESVARSLKIGLWISTKPIPPWDYKHGVKEGVSAKDKGFGLLPMLVQSQVQSGKKSVTVYIRKSGSQYHRGNCSSLKRSKIRVSLIDAVNNGYRPCYKCKPPVLEDKTDGANKTFNWKK